MKILHIVPSAPYNDNWGYQDNLLPSYHKKMGHEVTVITTNLMHKDGKIAETACTDYVLEDGVRVIRLPYKQYPHRILTTLCRRLYVYDLLEEIKPDFIFLHGLISTTVFDAVKYIKKHKNCTLVEDTHSDRVNFQSVGSTNFSKFVICRWYRLINRLSIRYVSRVYGVTPLRSQFAEDYFNIPKEKIGLLVMGADDAKIHFDQMPELRTHIRSELGLTEDDFVVITGGKIDRTKNIHLLMQAVSELNYDNLKLIVFGQPSEDMQSQIEKLSEDSHIRNIGWLQSDKVYDYFLASDLVAFPGTHSVLWEQACGCGLPAIFKDWEGMHHVDVGGNCRFLKEDSVNELKSVISEIYENKSSYQQMKKIAGEKGIPMFSYSQIARRAIGLENESSKK